MKPNCYECKFRGTLVGNCHSSCKHPSLSEKDKAFTAMSLLDGRENGFNKLEIRGNAHGIKSGWFMWPYNFDPVWLENCNGFEQKEEHEKSK